MPSAWAQDGSWSVSGSDVCSSLLSVSCRDEFSIQVLHAFVELHEFTDLNLVQALRWVSSTGHRRAGWL
jgi:hypothetical protein